MKPRARMGTEPVPQERSRAPWHSRGRVRQGLGGYRCRRPAEDPLPCATGIGAFEGPILFLSSLAAKDHGGVSTMRGYLVPTPCEKCGPDADAGVIDVGCEVGYWLRFDEWEPEWCSRLCTVSTKQASAAPETSLMGRKIGSRELAQAPIPIVRASTGIWRNYR